MGSVHPGNGLAIRVKLVHHIFARCHDLDRLIFVYGLKEPVNSDGSPTRRKNSRAPIRGYST
jgi:hypothetical protein